MNNPIIQLQNRTNPSEITDPIQIDILSDHSLLTTLLNTLLSKESRYIFYYKNERLAQSLGFIIEKHDLNAESAILIGYVDEIDIKCDFIRECDDIIVGMELFRNNLFYVTHGGFVFSLEDAFECSLMGIKGLFSGKKLLGFSEHSIYDVESCQELYKFEEEIRSCHASSNDFIAVATDSRIFLLDLNDMTPPGDLKDDCIIPTLAFPRSVFLNKQKVYWIESYNKIAVYDFGNKTRESFDCNSSVNSLHVYDSAIFATTANNKLIRISNGSVAENEILSRLASRIEVFGNTVLYSTQHEIIGLSQDGLSELGFSKVAGQINAMVASDEMVYVANDQKISGFLKHRFSGN